LIKNGRKEERKKGKPLKTRKKEKPLKTINNKKDQKAPGQLQDGLRHDYYSMVRFNGHFLYIAI
jgi:hypothetical protein